MKIIISLISYVQITYKTNILFWQVMDCVKCNLRFNTSSRRPKIFQCGHTICQECGNKIMLCPICQIIIDKTKSNINHSLLQMLQEKKIMKDIDKFIKVCFVGESQVGKTSLINRLKGQEYKQNTVATIGYDFAFEDRMIDEMNVRFQLWDSAGQQKYRAISPLHYKNSDIVVIVYDVTKGGNLNKVYGWYEEALKHCPENVIKIFVGNKTDLLDQINDKNINPLDAEAWRTIANEKIRNYQVSCKSYEGIEQFWKIMEQNVRIILKRITVISNPYEEISENSLAKIQKTKPTKKKLNEMKKQSKCYTQGSCAC